MKITRVRWTRYRIPFRTSYETAQGSTRHRNGIILQVETDLGISGLGEAPLPLIVAEDTLRRPSRRRSRFSLGLEERLAWGASHLKGREIEVYRPDSCDNLTLRPPEIDPWSMALWDALARKHGVPLAQLFNANSASAVTVNALVESREYRSVLTKATAANEHGFNTVKLKVGMASTVDDEIERVKGVRNVLGSAVKLRLDANGAWTSLRASDTLKRMGDLGIEYIEQPIPPGDPNGLLALRQKTPVPIAADEDADSYAHARRLIRLNCVDILVLKPSRFLSFSLTRKIAAAAIEAGIGAVVTTTIETGIGTAGCLQLAAAVGGPFDHGLGTLDLLEDDLIEEPGLPIFNGRMKLPDGPGLGVSLDEAALARYCEPWTELP